MNTNQINQNIDDFLKDITYLDIKTMEEYLSSCNIKYETRVYKSHTGEMVIMIYLDRTQGKHIRVKILDNKIKTNFAMAYFDSIDWIEHSIITGKWIGFDEE